MQTGILKYEQNTIHVNRMGAGNNLLFVFNDFGENASYFKKLEHAIGFKYTIIAIEIPGLGLSEWKSNTIDKLALVTIIERFKLEFKVEKFDIAAVGLGALYALTLIEQRSEWINNVILFNPLGLKRKSWQSLATNHFWAKGKIKKAAADVQNKEKHLKPLITWGLLKKEWLPELDAYLDNKSLQTLWQKVFPLHAKLIPEFQKIRWNVKKDQVNLSFFIAEDKLTLKKDAFGFAKKQNTVSVEFWEVHKFDNQNVVQQIEAILNPNK